jgi:hypothetical protein
VVAKSARRNLAPTEMAAEDVTIHRNQQNRRAPWYGDGKEREANETLVELLAFMHRWSKWRTTGNVLLKGMGIGTVQEIYCRVCNLTELNE